MSEIINPENLVELAKLSSVAIGSIVIAIYAIRSQKDTHINSIDKLYNLSVTTLKQNDELGKALTEIRIVIEKLCTLLQQKNDTGIS